MEQFEITEDEKVFIIRRRELAVKRSQSVVKPVAPKKEKAKDVILGENRPEGWDEHCNPCEIHAGRMTQTHPLYWFEEEIFKKISNMQHKDQHKLVRKLLKMPVQNLFRDRQYHALAHLEALWQQQLLPLKYKIRYEQYMAKHGIGHDFVHPKHKEKKPDYVHPMPNLKRGWDELAEATDEAFVVGKKYTYDFDKESGYKYKEAYKEELGE